MGQKDIDCMLCMSLKWKQRSYDAIVSSAGNKEKFVEAVLECGKGGHVLRTVSEPERDAFGAWVFDQYDMILAGKLRLSDIPRFGGRAPRSWVSKICHILNPWDYPIIFDSIVRERLGLTERSWQSVMEKMRKKKDSVSRQELYEYDSKLWAGGV